jgi:hypothetical protein
LVRFSAIAGFLKVRPMQLFENGFGLFRRLSLALELKDQLLLFSYALFALCNEVHSSAQVILSTVLSH